MKYIEMIGLSGVGKTTLLSSPENPIDDKVVTCDPVKVSFIAHFIQFVSLLIKLSVNSPTSAFEVVKKPAWVRLIFKIAYRIAGIRQRNFPPEEMVYLRDSGVLMPIVSSMLDDRLEIDCYTLHKFLEILPLPSMVFFVLDSDIEAVYYRFIEREKGNERDLSSYSINLFFNASQFLSQLANELSSFGVNIKKIYVNVK